MFDDQAAHDAYQTHPVHDRFRDECGGYWTAVRIYDPVGDDPERDAARAGGRGPAVRPCRRMRVMSGLHAEQPPRREDATTDE